MVLYDSTLCVKDYLISCNMANGQYEIHIGTKKAKGDFNSPGPFNVSVQPRSPNISQVADLVSEILEIICLGRPNLHLIKMLFIIMGN